MFAVIKTGGKQYRVAADDVITVARLAGEPGDAVAFDNVLLFGNDGKTEFGERGDTGTAVAGVSVAGEVVEQGRGPKVIAFKKRRRQNSKRKRGHRQDLTVIRITEILTGGKKPALKAIEGKPVAEEAKAPSEETTTKVKTPEAKASEDKAPEAKASEDKAPEAKASEDKAPEAKPAKGKAAKAEPAEDIELIAGIGPTIKKKLKAAGVATWGDIAGWTKADVAKYDEELNLRGRITREEWVEQAKELLAGKPPRARVDQEKAQDKGGDA